MRVKVFTNDENSSYSLLLMEIVVDLYSRHLKKKNNSNALRHKWTSIMSVHYVTGWLWDLIMDYYYSVQLYFFCSVNKPNLFSSSNLYIYNLSTWLAYGFSSYRFQRHLLRDTPPSLSKLITPLPHPTTVSCDHITLYFS